MRPSSINRSRQTAGRVRPVVSWLLVLLGLSVATVRGDAAAASKEYVVKAACLLNFAQYIQWPESDFAGPDAPIVVGVLGDDPFGTVLEQTFQDESVQGRSLTVKRSRQVDDLKTCHIIFISKSEKERLAETLASLNDVSVVTVGEIDDFALRGGIINFYIDHNKVRFEVNVDAAQRKGLKISSQLLKRARVVGSDSGKGGE
jgi:hypothetical protein